MCTKVAKFILEINKIHNYTLADSKYSRSSTVYDAFNWAAKIYEHRQIKQAARDTDTTIARDTEYKIEYLEEV